MKIRLASEGLDLVLVAATVIGIAGVQRLMHIGDQVDHVLEGISEGIRVKSCITTFQGDFAAKTNFSIGITGAR